MIATNLDEEEWIAKVQFDSSKLRWDADESEDDIDSEDFSW